MNDFLNREDHMIERESKRRPDELWELRLYVAGQTAKSLTAFVMRKQSQAACSSLVWSRMRMVPRW